MYVELNAGLAKPFMYRNSSGSLGSHHQFHSLILPYAILNGVLVLNDRLEAFAGLGITASWQGLRFMYTEATNDERIKAYTGALLLSLPLGLRYRCSEGLWLGVAPYLSYSSHTGYTEQMSLSHLGAESVYRFESPDDRHRINGGLKVVADVRMSQRLAAVVSAAADIGSATPSRGTADLRSGGGPSYVADLQPHLLHLSLGLSYRVWYKGE